MKEIYDPIKILHTEICDEVCKIENAWQLNQIKRYIANIQKED